MSETKKVIIVGAGLSGLSLAYFLLKKKYEVQILEVTNRVGGRIKTIKGKNQTPLELGATWIANEHVHLVDLLAELGIEKYHQYRKGVSLFHTERNAAPQQFEVPEQEPPTYRIAGGSERLIEALRQKIEKVDLQLGIQVNSITKTQNGVEVTSTENNRYTAHYAVVCMPPQLIFTSLTFSPKLPDAVHQLLPKVQTWMAGSIKFVLEYKEAFWRKLKFSGMLYSHVGIVTEMYDHTNKEENKFGFTGFLHPNAKQLTKAERKQATLTYLQAFFGNQILDYSFYEDQVWDEDNLVGNADLIQQPHLNNGDILLKKGYFDNQLFFAGTETSNQFPGYMDSAIASAKRVSAQIES